jgi:hypothetical protein
VQDLHLVQEPRPLGHQPFPCRAHVDAHGAPPALAAAAARSAARAIVANLEGEPPDSELAKMATAAVGKLAEAEEAERTTGHLLNPRPW